MYIYGKSKQNFSFYFRFRFGHTTNKQNQTNDMEIRKKIRKIKRIFLGFNNFICFISWPLSVQCYL